MSISFFGTPDQGSITYSEVLVPGLGSVRRPPFDSMGSFAVLEPDGSLSDLVYLFGPGDDRVIILSDPTLLLRIGLDLGTLAQEGDSGVTAIMAIPLFDQFLRPFGFLRFDFGFDGELVFPFGTVADTSDYVRVTFLEPVPEPTSLAVFGSGLAVLGYLVYRRRYARSSRLSIRGSFAPSEFADCVNHEIFSRTSCRDRHRKLAISSIG
jgi:hypothetical protein